MIARKAADYFNAAGWYRSLYTFKLMPTGFRFKTRKHTSFLLSVLMSPKSRELSLLLNGRC